MRHHLISPTSGILYKLHFYLTHRILFLFIQNKSKCKKRYLPILFYILIDKTKSGDKKSEVKNLPTHPGLAHPEHFSSSWNWTGIGLIYNWFTTGIGLEMDWKVYWNWTGNCSSWTEIVWNWTGLWLVGSGDLFTSIELDALELNWMQLELNWK